MTPTVSVAMAVFNGATYVREQVRSILAQNAPVGQLVVADDGSSDGTLELIRAELAEADVSVDLVVLAPCDTPLGVTANFERALAAADGDLIALSDQDDRWRSDRVASGVAALADPRVALAHGDATLIDSQGASLGATLFDAIGLRESEVALVGEGRAAEVLVRRNIVTGAAMMLRRELVGLARPFPVGWVHDEWLAIAAALTTGIATSRTPVIDYRLHGANQIGVTAPGLRTRVKRLLEPRGTRLRRIHETMTILQQRLPDWEVSEALVALIDGKVAFESARVTYPAARPVRLGPILRNAAGYPRFSSQGRLDLIRDLIQPA